MKKHILIGSLVILFGCLSVFILHFPFGFIVPFVFWGVYCFIEKNLLEVTELTGWVSGGLLIFWSVCWLVLGRTSEWKPTTGDHIMALVGSVVCAIVALICRRANRATDHGLPPSKIKRYRR